MKSIILSIAAGLLLSAGSLKAQDIPSSQVPSVIVNKFATAYPKATDIEWERKGELYNVEFEMGRNIDHEIWYDKSGNLVRHKEELSKNNLPSKVTAKLQQDFKGYRIDDVEKITEGTKVTYKMELKSFTKDWDMVMDADGNILKQKAD